MERIFYYLTFRNDQIKPLMWMWWRVVEICEKVRVTRNWNVCLFGWAAIFEHPSVVWLLCRGWLWWYEMVVVWRSEILTPWYSVRLRLSQSMISTSLNTTLSSISEYITTGAKYSSDSSYQFILFIHDHLWILLCFPPLLLNPKQ